MKARIALTAMLAFAAASCAPNDTQKLTGYVEGTYIHLSAETPGRLVERPVRAGGRVEAGELVFALDDTDQQAALAAAEARLAQTQAELANLTTGQRAEEVAVIEAELEAAEAKFKNADDDLQRKVALREGEIVTDAAVDAATSIRDAAAADVSAIERQLEVARLPARPEVLTAAERAVSAQQAEVDRARHALGLRTVYAPVGAHVENTFYEVGEMVSAGKAVASLLPDENRKIRFFVPEPELAGLDVGQTVRLSCDGCAEGLTAEVSYIASEAEFTPPVIFSEDARDKLVFMVEALPLGAALKLKVGQPVDVALGAGG